jgi:hypothetical protein
MTNQQLIRLILKLLKTHLHIAQPLAEIPVKYCPAIEGSSLSNIEPPSRPYDSGTHLIDAPLRDSLQP